LKTYFNQLIYNCGGIIIGLWFGLPPISLADLISQLRQKFTKILLHWISYIKTHIISFIEFYGKLIGFLFRYNATRVLIHVLNSENLILLKKNCSVSAVVYANLLEKSSFLF